MSRASVRVSTPVAAWSTGWRAGGQPAPRATIAARRGTDTVSRLSAQLIPLSHRLKAAAVFQGVALTFPALLCGPLRRGDAGLGACLPHRGPQGGVSGSESRCTD